MRGKTQWMGIIGLFLVSGCDLEQQSQPRTPSVPLPPAPTLHLGLSPEEAYAAIPTRRTKLDFGESRMDSHVRSYLEAVFGCIDQAIVLRVTTLDEYFAGKYAYRTYSSRHARLREYLESLTPPPQLRSYQDKLLEGLDAQRTFFAEWAETGPDFARGKDVFSHPEVRRCSGALIEAYRILSQEVGPQANRHEAFHDYHCALDFL